MAKRSRTKRKPPEVIKDKKHQNKLDASVVFPFGKYKDQQVESICQKDRNYCLWFMHNIVTNSILVGRVKDVIAKEYVPKPTSRAVSAAYTYDSEAYCDYNEDLADAYSFAMHDGGGCPFF